MRLLTALVLPLLATSASAQSDPLAPLPDRAPQVQKLTSIQVPVSGPSEKPMMLTTRIQRPPIGHENVPVPGPTPGVCRAAPAPARHRGRRARAATAEGPA